jgi:hypothetical protein
MSYEMSSVSKLNKKGSNKTDGAGTGELNSSKDNSREVLIYTISSLFNRNLYLGRKMHR